MTTRMWIWVWRWGFACINLRTWRLGVSVNFRHWSAWVDIGPAEFGVNLLPID